MERPFGRRPCRDSQFESIIFRECKEWEREGEWEFLKAGGPARKAAEDDLEWEEGVKDDRGITPLGILTEHALSYLGRSDETFIPTYTNNEHAFVGSLLAYTMVKPQIHLKRSRLRYATPTAFTVPLACYLQCTFTAASLLGSPRYQ